jgi:hypothetical protein
MGSDEIATSRDESGVVAQWTARKVQPIIMLYVAGVFGAFMALSHFVFHSTAAVKALAIAAVGAMISMVPGVMAVEEYRLTDAGLEKRSLNEKKPRQFNRLFTWDQLHRVVPTRHGFKYYTSINEPRPMRRFWKTHISDACSGEVHAEPEDLDRVLGLLSERGIRSADGQRSG